MGIFTFWSYEIAEHIQDFIDSPLSNKSVESLVAGLSLGSFQQRGGPVSGNKLLLVYSETNYAFTATDISWLNAARSVVFGSLKNGLSLFAVDVHCNEEDYYIYCAAIIKLFNLVFHEKSYFVFKINDIIAFGCKREYEKNISLNDFCISAPIAIESIEEHLSFLDDLSMVENDDIPNLIISHYPQEFFSSNKSTDILNENQSISFDLKSRNRRSPHIISNYLESDYSYIETCRLLQNVARIDNASSFDILEDAQSAVRKKEKHFQSSLSSVTEDFNSDVLDADNLLSEILDNTLF